MANGLRSIALDDEEPKPRLTSVPLDQQEPRSSLTSIPIDQPAQRPSLAATGTSLVREAIKPFFPKLPTSIPEAVSLARQPLRAVSPEPLAITPQVQRFTRGAASGIVGAVGQTLAFEPAVETRLGLKTKFGRDSLIVSKALTDFAQKIAPKDPTLADKVASGFGSMALFIIPGTAGARAASLIPRIGRFSTLLARGTGAGIAGFFESATESGGVFLESLSRGDSEEIASNNAMKDFGANVIITGLTNFFGLFGKSRSLIKRTVLSASLEGIQEALQEIARTTSQNLPVNWRNVWEGLGIGAFLGGGTSVAISPFLEGGAQPTDQIVSRETIPPTQPPPVFTGPTVSRVSTTGPTGPTVSSVPPPGATVLSTGSAKSIKQQVEKLQRESGIDPNAPEATPLKSIPLQQEGPTLAPEGVEERPVDIFKREFTPATNISQEESITENNAREFAEDNADRILDEYETKFANEVSVDKIRDFFRPVGFTGLNSATFHEPASALGKALEPRVLKKAREQGKKEILIMAGGSGAGKTTSLEQFGTEKSAFGMVVDANSAKLENTAKRIDRLLNQGFNVSFKYVYRHPVDAWFDGVVGRVVRGTDPRAVPIDTHLSTHPGSLDTVFQVAEKYKGNPNVNIEIVDNSFGKGNAKKITLEELRKKSYNINEVQEVIESGTLQALQEGRLSREFVAASLPVRVPARRRTTAPTGVAPTDIQASQRTAQETRRPPTQGVVPVSPTVAGTKEFFRQSLALPLEQARTAQLEIQKPSPEQRLLPSRQAPQKLINEMAAFRRSLQREAHAAALAAQVTTRELTSVFSQKVKDISQIKKDITSLIKENLPLAERGRFISKVASAKTGEDVAKAAVLIEQRAAEIQKKLLIKELQRTSKRALQNSKIDVFYKTRIGQVMDSLQFTKPTAKTVQRIKEMDAFIQRQRENGEDITLPQRYLDELKIFKRKDVQSLTTKELENLNFSINLLSKLGRLNVLNRQIAYDQEKSERLSALVAGTKAINKRQLDEAPFGQQLSTMDRVGNTSKRFMNELQRIDIAISPPDVVFDFMDGNKAYRGVNSTLIKGKLDIDFNNYLQDMNQWIPPVQRKAKSLGLSDKNFERIMVHAMRVQPGGRAYLLNNNLTDEQIDGVKLTENEMTIYRDMRRIFDETGPRVAEVMRELYNQDISLRPSYFPVQIDRDAVSDIEVFQRVGDLMNADAFGRKTKTVEIGFTKARQGTGKKINLNAMEVFTKHMDDVAYLLNTQRDIKMLSEIVNSPRYRQAAGETGALFASQYMDTMARKGGADAYKRIQVLDTLRKNFGVAMLGFKLSSILVQPTAYFDGAARVGGAYVAQGAQRVITSKEWRVFLRDNFPELRDRGADDIAFLELPEGKLMRGMHNAGFSGLKKFDVITAAGVTAGAYQRALDEMGQTLDLSNPNQQAIQQAQLSMRRTQSSAFFKDMTQAQSRGGATGNRSFDRALFQFKSFMLGRWSQIRHDAWRAGVREGNVKQGVEIMTWLSIATVVETFVRLGSRLAVAGATAALFGLFDPDKDSVDEARKRAEQLFKKEFKDIKQDILLEFLGTVPFLGDVLRTAMYRSSSIPSFSFVQKLGGGVLQIGGKRKKGQSKKDFRRSKVQGAVRLTEAAGAVLGIPGTSQAAQIAREALRKPKRRSNALPVSGLGGLRNRRL